MVLKVLLVISIFGIIKKLCAIVFRLHGYRMRKIIVTEVVPENVSSKDIFDLTAKYTVLYEELEKYSKISAEFFKDGLSLYSSMYSKRIIDKRYMYEQLNKASLLMEKIIELHECIKTSERENI